jgi:pentatricopeptide repeat domain-containing protein 1
MMIAAGVSANQFTFGILLESAGAGGRLKAALGVFNEMRAAGVAPQTSTYNFLIEACAAAPHPDVSFYCASVHIKHEYNLDNTKISLT